MRPLVVEVMLRSFLSPEIEGMGATTTLQGARIGAGVISVIICPVFEF